jgi:hypothetical protein
MKFCGECGSSRGTVPDVWCPRCARAEVLRRVRARLETAASSRYLPSPDANTPKDLAGRINYVQDGPRRRAQAGHGAVRRSQGFHGAARRSRSRGRAQARRSGTRAPIQIRIGLNSSDVLALSIGSDLRMDYTAVGQTTHLATRMEQLAMLGSILVTPHQGFGGTARRLRNCRRGHRSLALPGGGNSRAHTVCRSRERTSIAPAGSTARPSSPVHVPSRRGPEGLSSGCRVGSTDRLTNGRHA